MSKIISGPLRARCILAAHVPVQRSVCLVKTSTGIQHNGKSKQLCRASSPYQTCISEAEKLVIAKDMIGALNQFELALKEGKEDMPLELRRKLLFNACAIHAGFGDLELAQIPLREAMELAGNDPAWFEQSLLSPEPGMIPMKAPQQIVISLKRFAKARSSRAPTSTPEFKPAQGVQLTPAGVRVAMAQDDVQEMLGTEIRGDSMDKSLGGILRRVALLLVSLIAVGAGLFWGGLQFMFPDGI